MTYEEALKANVEKVNIGRVTMPSMVFTGFLKSFAILSCLFAETICKQDYPTAIIGKENCGGGEGKAFPSTQDILAVLTCNDFLRGSTFSHSITEFLDWLLEQRVPENLDDDEKGMWYDYQNILNEWNKYISKG